jgi:hypothetical protein
MDPASILSQTTLHVRRGPYAIAAWPKEQAPSLLAATPPNEAFAMLILDELEATAVLPEATLEVLPPPTSSEPGWSVITLDQPMSWDLVGILAAVTTALAGAGISVGAGTAYSRDHLLVPTARLDDALAALTPLCAGVTLEA